MTRYSVQSRDRIFGKAYVFLSFTRNIGKNIGKNKSRHLSSKYRNSLKSASKRAIQKTVAATVDLIGKKAADNITKLSGNSVQN